MFYDCMDWSFAWFGSLSGVRLDLYIWIFNLIRMHAVIINKGYHHNHVYQNQPYLPPQIHKLHRQTQRLRIQRMPLTLDLAETFSQEAQHSLVLRGLRAEGVAGVCEAGGYLDTRMVRLGAYGGMGSRVL